MKVMVSWNFDEKDREALAKHQGKENRLASNSDFKVFIWNEINTIMDDLRMDLENEKDEE